MATARRSTSGRAGTARKSTGRRTTSRSSSSREPAALKRLNRSLDSAQEALKVLRKDVGRDVSSGTRGLYGDLQKFVREARRDSTKLGKSLGRDVQKLQQGLTAASRGKRATGSTSRRSSSAKRSSSRSGSRSRSR